MKSCGYEVTTKKPGWITNCEYNIYADNDLNELILFYVINTPCEGMSGRAITLTRYGWDKKIWRNDKLKNYLFSIPNFERGSSFVVAHKTNEMKETCQKVSLGKGFNRNRDKERIAIYKGDYNEFLSICYHIRNAFAHGRFAIYGDEKNKDEVFVLEDGKNQNGEFQVRARMVLKKTTLIKWMQILKAGKLPDDRK